MQNIIANIKNKDNYRYITSDGRNPISVVSNFERYIDYTGKGK